MSLQETPMIRSAGPADIPALVAVHRDSAEFHQGLDAQQVCSNSMSALKWAWR
jgi:hypothetical protein